MERDMRRSKTATVSATRELETYRVDVEMRIADNALMKQNPKIPVKVFGFLSAEISRTSKTVLKDLGFAKDLPGGPGAFIRKFEWEMAKFRANSSFSKKRNSERRFRWEHVEIPDNWKLVRGLAHGKMSGKPGYRGIKWAIAGWSA